jgi:hypothetical protein
MNTFDVALVDKSLLKSSGSCASSAPNSNSEQAAWLNSLLKNSFWGQFADLGR